MLITQQKIALLRLEVGDIEEADFQFEQVINNLENLNINFLFLIPRKTQIIVSIIKNK